MHNTHGSVRKHPLVTWLRSTYGGGMAHIAVLGTGRMGTAIATRLVARGHEVTVWNRTAERARVAGTHRAASPAAAAREAEVVITMLTDAKAVEAVLCGPDGAGGALRPDARVVEMSTIGPVAVRRLARRLRIVDAPVGGSVGAAAAGNLLILAGGAAEDVAAVRPVLDDLGQVRECGPSGTGAALKLVLNTALVTGVTALADTLEVAAAVGVDRTTALDVLAQSALGRTVERVTGGGAFTVALARKDLNLAIDALASEPAPVARASADVLASIVDQEAELTSLVTKEHP